MDKTNSISGSVLESLQIKKDQTKSSNKLGQDDFLNLMIAQLKNQDPSKPAESAEFLSQLAQFGTVNGITELQKSFTTLATSLQSNQALQASTMVGRSVLVDSATARLAGAEGVDGAVDLDQAAGALTVSIHAADGTLVRRIDLGNQQAGLVRFKWDGLDEGGVGAPPGLYRLKAEASFDGTSVAQPTLVQARVESVTLVPGGGSPQLNLANFGAVAIEDVREVM